MCTSEDGSHENKMREMFLCCVCMVPYQRGLDAELLLAGAPFVASS